MALYQRLLAGRFPELHPVLQRFHGEPGCGAAQGQLTVERGSALPARIIAVLLRLPPSGCRIPVDLTVTRKSGEETWIRTFAGRRFVSRQNMNGQGLIESFAIMSFAFRPRVIDDSLHLVSHRFYLLGIPVPRPLAPQVRASEQGDHSGWRLRVDVRLARIGLLFHYSGHMRLQ